MIVLTAENVDLFVYFQEVLLKLMKVAILLNCLICSKGWKSVMFIAVSKYFCNIWMALKIPSTWIVSDPSTLLFVAWNRFVTNNSTQQHIPLQLTLQSVTIKTAVPGSLAGCASTWYSDGRRGSILRSGKTFFRGVWSWHHFFAHSLPTKFKQGNYQILAKWYALSTGLSLPRKSMIRLT